MKIPHLSRRLTVAVMSLMALLPATALRLEPIPYGDFSGWVTRQVKESKILGGKVKTAYEIRPNSKIAIYNNPYYNLGGPLWATSNVYAKVAGIVKGVDAVSPGIHAGNRCARLEARMEHLKVLGIVNMDVIVQGTIFLGEIKEPISSTKTPFSKMAMGMPYTKRPKALVYDFSVDMPNVNTRVKATGLGPVKTLQGRDNAEVYVLLQRRWEDEKGNIYAKRVGTGRELFGTKTDGWVNGHEIKVNYGDITSEPYYKPFMGLIDKEKSYYARNSKGKMVPVTEVGWDSPDATPTHMLMMASAGSGTAYIGTIGLNFWVDNFALKY